MSEGLKWHGLALDIYRLTKEPRHSPLEDIVPGVGVCSRSNSITSTAGDPQIVIASYPNKLNGSELPLQEKYATPMAGLQASMVEERQRTNSLILARVTYARDLVMVTLYSDSRRMPFRNIL